MPSCRKPSPSGCYNDDTLGERCLRECDIPPEPTGYRLLDPPPKCCGTCRYWAQPEGFPTHWRSAMCLCDEMPADVPTHPAAWGLCEKWEVTDD